MVLWYLAEIEWLLLRSFCLARLPFPGSLARKNGPPLGASLVCACCSFSLLASSAPGLEYMRQYRKPGNSPLCSSLGPDVPAGLSSSLHLSESSHVYFMYNVQGTLQEE